MGTLVQGDLQESVGDLVEDELQVILEGRRHPQDEVEVEFVGLLDAQTVEVAPCPVDFLQIVKELKNIFENHGTEHGSC